MSTAFDTSLEQADRYQEAEAYALPFGRPGTPAYRAAWVRFTQRVKTADDLGRWRRARAARAARAYSPNPRDDPPLAAA